MEFELYVVLWIINDRYLYVKFDWNYIYGLDKVSMWIVYIWDNNKNNNKGW